MQNESHHWVYGVIEAARRLGRERECLACQVNMARCIIGQEKWATREDVGAARRFLSRHAGKTYTHDASNPICNRGDWMPATAKV